MKTLLGVLAATIWGSSRSRVRLHTDLKVPVSSGDVTDPPRQSTRFSCHGVSPDHDDCTDILYFPARVLVIPSFGGKGSYRRATLIPERPGGRKAGSCR